jgi:hypothetical protein
MCAASLWARTLFFTWLVCRRRHIPSGKLARRRARPAAAEVSFSLSRALIRCCSKQKDDGEGELLYVMWERMKNEENRGQFYHPTRESFSVKRPTKS